MAKSPVREQLRIRPVRRSDWAHIEILFGSSGACAGCWCMSWRLPRGGKLYEQNKGAPNRRSFRRLLQSGEVHGLLAFDGKEPLGWCAVGPKSEFPKLENSRVLKLPEVGNDWAVLCFFIRRDRRRSGVATQLLHAAIAYARRHEATLLDGFPVLHPQDRDVAAAFAWTGVPEMFESCGFRHVRRKDTSRPLYRIHFDRRSGGRPA